MGKHAIVILTPGDAPRDNGVVITALRLAQELKAAGEEVRTHLGGRGVEWAPRFEGDRDAHPFTKHYGHVWDDVRDTVSCCNMCLKRFDTSAGELPVHGEGQDHAPLGAWVLEGFTLHTF